MIVDYISAVKRLMREAQELRDATDEYYAYPLDENLFEWHFTVQGPPSTDFAGGVYHGRILLPNEYPMKPPNIILLTVSYLTCYQSISYLNLVNFRHILNKFCFPSLMVDLKLIRKYV